MAERSEISIHELRVYRTLEASKGWLASNEVAERSKVAKRTARAHLLKFVRLNIVDQAEVFPGHRYRLAEKAGKRNAAYMLRLKMAAEVLGSDTEGRQ